MGSKVNNIKRALFLLFILSLSETSFYLPPENMKDIFRFYLVTKVVDGDTFWIDDGSEKGLKIRLIGVDAPESHKTGSKEKSYYGKEAAEYLTRLIGGKKVRLEYDVNRLDQYGRTLAYVHLGNGTFVNADLLKNGYAMIMTVSPNIKYAKKFLKLSQKARKMKEGLWGKSERKSLLCDIGRKRGGGSEKTVLLCAKLRVTPRLEKSFPKIIFTLLECKNRTS
jgi:micrococcal nuclease